jgi:hypothetical protein
MLFIYSEAPYSIIQILQANSATTVHTMHYKPPTSKTNKHKITPSTIGILSNNKNPTFHDLQKTKKKKEKTKHSIHNYLPHHH